MKTRLNNIIETLERYKVLISVLGICLSVISIINHFGSQRDIYITNTWRDSISRVIEDIIHGGKAYPIKTQEEWAVAFEREATQKYRRKFF